MIPAQWLEVAQTLGAPFLVLLIFMAWSYKREQLQMRQQAARETTLEAQQQKREERLSTRIERLEEWQKNELMVLVRENTKAFHEFGKALERATKGRSGIFSGGED